MINTIATDLDGTLFYPKKFYRIISTKNRKFLRKFVKEEGKNLILVSGRNIGLLSKVTKAIEHDDVSMIACNGSLIYHKNEIVYENPISHEDVKMLNEYFKTCKEVIGVFYMINNKGFIVVPNNVSRFVSFIAKVGIAMQGAYKEKFKYGEKYLNRILDKEDVKFYKIMPIYGFGKKGIKTAREQYDALIEKFGDRFEVMFSSNSVELMKKGVNKAYALKMLLDMLKLKECQTAVIGDSGNDIPMFEEFENSFCMEKAPEEVKEKAKNIVKGVYEIEKFL